MVQKSNSRTTSIVVCVVFVTLFSHILGNCIAHPDALYEVLGVKGPSVVVGLGALIYGASMAGTAATVVWLILHFAPRILIRLVLFVVPGLARYVN